MHNKNAGELLIVTTTLKSDAGGRTRSLISRACLMSERDVRQVTICSTAYDTAFNGHVNDLRDQGRLNSNIVVINLYEDLKASGFDAKLVHISHDKFDAGYSVIVENGHRYIHYLSGVKSYIKDFDKRTGLLHHINYYHDTSRRLHKRDFYGVDGRIHKREIFHENKYLIVQEVFFSQDGAAYLSKLFKPNAEEKVLEEVVLFNPICGKSFFRDMDELVTYWLESKIKQKATFVCDARVLDNAVLNISKMKSKRVFQLHSNYHQDPKNISTGFKGRARPLSKRANEADVVVALTNDQRQGFLNATNVSENKVVCIPHSTKIPQLNFVCGSKVVVVSRLASGKQIEHAIIAFSRFLSLYPQFTMHIYGLGPHKCVLEKLIESCGIEEKCFLEGYTDNVSKVFQEASFSLMTSELEGFALSVMESLANGCPVISYDINFGPRDLVVNEVNGYLVPPGDIDALTEKMACLVKSSMIENRASIQKSMRDFSNESFVEKWNKVIDF